MDVKEINGQVNGTSPGHEMMECPWCKGYGANTYDRNKQHWKFDKWITPIRARYICGNCNMGVQYEM